jgi:ribosomal protein S18 acetylase RimI-like enzyme
LPPDGWEVTPERAARAGLDQLPALIGADAVERFDHVLGFLESFHRRDVLSKHWYVMVVGVIPARQEQGFGRALLRPVLDRADAEGLPCYLETAQPENVPFYQKLGFGVIARLSLGADCGCGPCGAPCAPIPSSQRDADSLHRQLRFGDSN